MKIRLTLHLVSICGLCLLAQPVSSATPILTQNVLSSQADIWEWDDLLVQYLQILREIVRATPRETSDPVSLIDEIAVHYRTFGLPADIDKEETRGVIESLWAHLHPDNGRLPSQSRTTLLETIAQMYPQVGGDPNNVP